MILSGIVIYPVKGLRGIPLESVEVSPEGLREDRRWLIYRPDSGRFASQRCCAAMARLRAIFVDSQLRLSADDDSIPDFFVARDQPGERRLVEVWGDRLSAIDVGDRAADWLSKALEDNLRLARLDNPQARKEHGLSLGAADGYPLLIASERSLEELNKYANSKIPMDRFRANLIIRGLPEPWMEHKLHELTIGAIPIRGCKPCARCLVTTTDQRSGQRLGPEPLQSLHALQPSPDGPLFGLNAVALQSGILNIGDPVTLIEKSGIH